MGVVLLLESSSSSSSSSSSASSSATEDQQQVAETRAAASFLAQYDNTLGLILPSSKLIAAARQGSVKLPLFVRAGEGDLSALTAASADPNIFVALDRTHTDGVADIASSNSNDDRLKMYYHENIACQGRALIEYSSCFKQMPVYVFNGFNLAIDDCIHQDEPDRFQDYGQCGRLDERVNSPWWHRHQRSFAARQLAGYETGLGWTFDAWKLYQEDPDTSSLLDEPAKLYALKNVAAAGLFPSLLHKDASKLKLACLNNPEPDFALGDDTLAPTPGPPPDCGNGWWNYETQQCDYWIPPPPCPTAAPIPTCEGGGFWSQELGQCDYCPLPLTKTALVHSGLIGGAVGLVVGIALGALAWKVCCRSRRDEGYTPVPSAGISA
jgi:hypothetical protein